jgi:hypothetical protein
MYWNLVAIDGVIKNQLWTQIKTEYIVFPSILTDRFSVLFLFKNFKCYIQLMGLLQQQISQSGGAVYTDSTNTDERQTPKSRVRFEPTISLLQKTLRSIGRAGIVIEPSLFDLLYLQMFRLIEALIELKVFCPIGCEWEYSEAGDLGLHQGAVPAR